MNIHMTDNCGACRWWAPCAAQPFIGVCGHKNRPGDRTTDKLDTCKLFEMSDVRSIEEALA
jgi:hypothetical protein